MQDLLLLQEAVVNNQRLECKILFNKSKRILWRGPAQFSYMLLLMQFSVRTRIGKNKYAINRVIRQSTPALSVLFFSMFERIVLMALVFYYKNILEKGNNAKNPAILSFFFVTEEIPDDEISWCLMPTDIPGNLLPKTATAD